MTETCRQDKNKINILLCLTETETLFLSFSSINTTGCFLQKVNTFSMSMSVSSNQLNSKDGFRLNFKNRASYI